ncbi:MAG TPA: YggT family protein [Anaerolineaceae bacterium]|nr:YggT family protein [Anaerolineaceae bacterium]
MQYFLVQLIDIIARILILVIIVDSVISFFLSPYHPFREFLDRIVNPLLAPIRRVVPPIGGLDLSPLVLIILIYVIEGILRSLILAI